MKDYGRNRVEGGDWVLAVNDRLALIERCFAMGVYLNIRSRTNEQTGQVLTDSWIITVDSGLTRSRDGKPHATHSCIASQGPLPILANDCLDHYQAEQTWTDEELLVIAGQSGLDVSRA